MDLPHEVTVMKSLLRNTSIKSVLFAALGCAFPIVMASPGYADEMVDKALRKGKWEIMLAPQFTLAKNLGFDGGTTAKIEDTAGFNFQFGYNFNEHWNVGGLFSWSRPDYHAVVQPVEGNTAGPRTQHGTVETNTFALVTTYNFIAGPLTPFVDLNFGGRMCTPTLPRARRLRAATGILGMDRFAA
jgi:opacity protein-like surface antigen